MRLPRFALAALVALASLSPVAAEPPMDAPLVKDGPVLVDRADFEGALLRVPDVYRPEVRMSAERVATLIDSVFVSRVLATRAHAEGLDKDIAVQRRMKQLGEAFLADLYRQKFEKDIALGDLEQRARELYMADRSQYVVPEQAEVQQILVDLKGRTPEMARARAEKVLEEVKSGKDEFLSYALKYSDEEQQREKLRGDLGWVFPQKLVAPVRDALAKMHKGEVAGPIQSEYGFHIVKLVDRKPAKELAFDEVKKNIIASEKERIVKERMDGLLREIRSSPTTTLYKENVDALVLPVDLGAVKRAQEAPPAAK
jgi:peptidyl-prolyl cis-trans isomerase C